jgi:hypothetical protein
VSFPRAFGCYEFCHAPRDSGKPDWARTRAGDWLWISD